MNGWLRDERAGIAAERILDAAAHLFVDRGVASTGMTDVARAAGCSRATVYRYFENRRALHLAFVNREARRIAARVAGEVAAIADPAQRSVAAIQSTLSAVRSQPTLIGWFASGDAGIAAEIGHSSEVIQAIGAGFLTDAGIADRERAARWIVRIIVSLLTVPGIDADDERAMLERFVAPALTAATAGRAQS